MASQYCTHSLNDTESVGGRKDTPLYSSILRMPEGAFLVGSGILLYHSGTIFKPVFALPWGSDNNIARYNDIYDF